MYMYEIEMYLLIEILSHSSHIHIKNILKNQDKTAAIVRAAFIHVYIYIYIQFQCFCSPDMMPAYLKRNEKVSKSIEEIGEEI
jgi:hypothetical protein